MLDARYSRNIGSITEEENLSLADKRVLVAGCGGLGGYVIENLGRMGVGHITAVDYDVFEPTNLNRQLTSEAALMGVSKVKAAKARMQRVNPLVKVEALEVKISGENAKEIIAGHDVVVDALDSLPPRRALQNACEELGLPLVHGAIGGWYGQVTVIMPGDRLFDELYGADVERGAEVIMGNPSFTPAVVGSIQACETIKLLIGRKNTLQHRMLSIDLLNEEYVVFAVK